MTSARILLVDLDSPNGWGEQTRRVIEAMTQKSVVVTYEAVSSMENTKAVQRILSIAKTFSPDMAVFLIDAEHHTSAGVLFQAFHDGAPCRPIVAVTPLSNSDQGQH